MGRVWVWLVMVSARWWLVAVVWTLPGRRRGLRELVCGQR